MNRILKISTNLPGCFCCCRPWSRVSRFRKRWRMSKRAKSVWRPSRRWTLVRPARVSLGWGHATTTASTSWEAASSTTSRLRTCGTNSLVSGLSVLLSSPETLVMIEHICYLDRFDDDTLGPIGWPFQRGNDHPPFGHFNFGCHHDFSRVWFQGKLIS